MVAVVKKEEADQVIATFEQYGEKASIIGRVVSGEGVSFN